MTDSISPIAIGAIAGTLFALVIVILHYISTKKSATSTAAAQGTPTTLQATPQAQPGWTIKSILGIVVIAALIIGIAYALLFTSLGKNLSTRYEVATLKTPTEAIPGQEGATTTYLLPAGAEFTWSLTKNPLVAGQKIVITTQAMTKHRDNGIVFDANGIPILGGSQLTNSQSLLPNASVGTVLGSVEPFTGTRSSNYFVIGSGPTTIEIFSDYLTVNGKYISIRNGTSRTYLNLGVNYPKEDSFNDGSIVGRISVNVRYI